ncbi:putative endonuclease 4 [Dictyocoela muelleri]|nr:putative endonuclease 4 [Dictyocoela muelleri]
MNKKSKKILGAHLSVSKGLSTLQNSMDEINADTCAFFLKNQRRFESSPLNENEIKQFKKKIMNPEFFLPHGSYLINMANSDEIKSAKMYNCLVDDIRRCHKLGIKLYNVHPGSDVLNNRNKSISKVIETINRVHKDVDDVIIVVENMAGQGKVLCSSFEEINKIISNVYNKERIGVCLDTCHLFSAGYDLRFHDIFQKTFEDFDRSVGLKYLRGMHLNDSKMELGSKKDRHENLGKGLIGWTPFKMIMKDERFDNIPLILETPNTNLYGEEIKILRGFEENESELN